MPTKQKLSPFQQCWNEATLLRHVDTDPMRHSGVSDVVFAAQFEVDLHDSGESDLTPKQLAKIKAFITRWEGK